MAQISINRKEYEEVQKVALQERGVAEVAAHDLCPIELGEEWELIFETAMWEAAKVYRLTMHHALIALNAPTVQPEPTNHHPREFNNLFNVAEYFAQEIMATDSFRHENKDNSLFLACLENGELTIELEELVCDWLDSVACFTEQRDLSLVVNFWKVSNI